MEKVSILEDLKEAYSKLTLKDLQPAKLIPTDDQIKTVVTAYKEWTSHTDDTAWQNGKGKKYCPAIIAWKVCPKGPDASIESALCLFAISILIDWTELTNQLSRTINQTYGLTKEQANEVLQTYWIPNMAAITAKVNKIFITNAIVEKLSTVEATRRLVESLDPTTPYMLRNDGALIACGEVHPYIKPYYNEGFAANYDYAVKHPEMLQWFYENTLQEEVKELIDAFKAGTVDEDAFTQLANATNQEFCRVRTSNYKYKYGGDNGEIYFRLSSTGFNWFDLIWKVVNDFKNQIRFVTIMHDFATCGKQFNYVTDGKNVFNKMPVDEFLTLNGNPVVEDLDLIEAEEVDEDIEKHEELNPKLFDGEKLKPEVRDHFMRIVDEFKSMLDEDGIELNIKDIIITGSNASYNYTKDSDIDLHIVADTSDLDDSDGKYSALYNAYKTIWNSKYEITTYDIPTGIYVETDDTARVSNGCYSVLNDEWVKKPELETIPDLNQDEFDKAFAEWENRYDEIINSVNGSDQTELTEALNRKEQERKMDEWHRRTRGANVASMGPEKLKMNYDICKEKGYLAEKLALLGAARDRAENGLKDYDWVTKEFQPRLLKLTCADLADPVLNSSLPDWLIASVAVLRDGSPCGAAPTRQKIKLLALISAILKSDEERTNVLKDKLQREGYTVAELKAAIEDTISDPDFVPELEDLLDGIPSGGAPLAEGLNEELHTPEIDKISRFIDDVYALRKQSLADEGEYGTGNLIFKELRNRGYLDRLKELKTKLVTKELSLED